MGSGRMTGSFDGWRGPSLGTGAGGGSQGPQGPQGPQGGGAQGAQGFQGTMGSTGAQGFQGFQGSTGAQGFQGPSTNSTLMMFAANIPAAILNNYGMVSTKQQALAANQYLPAFYPPHGTASQLKVNATTNSNTSDVTVRLYKNGAAAGGAAVLVAAGTTGVGNAAGPSITFDGVTDILDVVVECGAGGGGGVLQLSAILTYQIL